ncbi:Mitogen-activated protein kinase kinase [Thalictrum thalictroides]|uniref:mitogen-activated protein kinase kinase n=1 Tax=Thalictrum thalictroides TaxID=46969 RepID=A0A7J6VLX9_THATH|nr:Mitogen-activated protein kinase kinase [Thalictrum thalictroides]
MAAVVRKRRQLNLHLPLPAAKSSRFSSSPLRLPLPLSLPYNNNNSVYRVSDFDKLQVLGHGNSGTVYKVQHKRTLATYALKVIHGDCDTTVRRQITREVHILSITDSPYVVSCHGIFEKSPGGDISILLEYMDSGTLDNVLKTTGTFSEVSISNIALQVLNGLNYLHKQKIVHRDIKPANLLVNSKMEVKIADFGVSKMMSRTLDSCDSYVGTCAYMSPERFDPDTYGANYNGYAADIWSLGLTLVELFVGHFPLLPPGAKPDWASLMCAICFGDQPTLQDTSASEDFRDFIKCCLQKDSTKRWTVMQLLAHPFVNQRPI